LGAPRPRRWRASSMRFASASSWSTPPPAWQGALASTTNLATSGSPAAQGASLLQPHRHAADDAGLVDSRPGSAEGPGGVLGGAPTPTASGTPGPDLDSAGAEGDSGGLAAHDLGRVVWGGLALLGRAERRARLRGRHGGPHGRPPRNPPVALRHARARPTAAGTGPPTAAATAPRDTAAAAAFSFFFSRPPLILFILRFTPGTGEVPTHP